MLPSGGLFPSYGIELIPLFPYLSAGLLKKGGNIRTAPGNQLLATDHDFQGFPELMVDPGLEKNWLLYLGLAFATPLPPPPSRVEIFGVNALRGKRQQLGLPNLRDIFIGG